MTTNLFRHAARWAFSAALALGAGTAANAASLVGDTVDVDFANVAGGNQSVVVVAGTREIDCTTPGNAFCTDFVLFANEFIDIEASSIVMHFEGGFLSGAVLTFTGLDFDDPTQSIVGITVVGGLPGQSPGDYSFTGHSVSINLETTTAGGDVTINLITGAKQDVPEPASLALALVGTGLALRRRRQS